MKPYYLHVFTASALLFSSHSLSANQKDDLKFVNKLIELYPEVDLSKEAILQTELIAQKYSKDIASILTGKIRYKTNQKSLARKSFREVSKSSEHFKDSVLTYYLSAIDEKVNDSSGVKEASELFIANKLWEGIENRDGEEWATVEKIFKSYSDFFRNDQSKLAELKKILNTLNVVIDLEGETESLISENEDAFLNKWSLETGKLINQKKLETLLSKLEDLEFGEKTYEFFTAFPNRARVLVLLGKPDRALELLENTKSKIIDYDKILKEHVSKDKKLTQEQKQQAISQMSVMSMWYYAKAIACFQNYRTEIKKPESGELLFGKYGAAVNFYLCVKKFPENEYSYKSILAYQSLRELISKQYSKNMKELSVSNLVQGKAFYIAKDYENAFKYLSQALQGNNESDVYEAYNLVIGTAVKLSKYDDADKFFTEMSDKFAKLNKAPNDYISRLVNFLAATYLKQLADLGAEEKLKYYNRARKIFAAAKENGSRKSNVTVKYLLVSKFLNHISQLKPKKAKAEISSISTLVNSLLNDHKLSKESVKVLRTLGLTHHKIGNSKAAIDYIDKYLDRIKSFSAKVDEDQIKMKMLLVELMINESDLKNAAKNFNELVGYKSALAEEISALNVRLLHSKLLLSPQSEIKEGYLKVAEEHVSKYKNSKARPYIIAQLALVYQNSNMSAKANSLYSILQTEYPEHEVNEGTGINQVLALLKGGREHKALESLSKMDDLKSLSQTNLYAVLVKIYDGFWNEKLTGNQAGQLLKVMNELDLQSLDNDHMLQKAVLMKSDALLGLKEFEAAEKLLSGVLEKLPQGSYVVDLNLKLGESLAGTKNYSRLSKVYSSIQNLVRRMNGGVGDPSLTVKISAEFAEHFSTSEDEKFMKKGKYISFLAAQFNAAVIKKQDLIYLEKAEYWNAWYSKKMNQEDFLELKKSFLTKYPSSIYAPDLRKL